MNMRSFVLFGAALSAVLLLGSGNAFAQQPVAPAGCTAVLAGDNLWTFDNNFNLAALAAKNPDLKPALDAPERQFTTKFNQLGVKIFANEETICGVTRSGSQLIPTPSAKAAATPSPAPNRNDPPAPRPVLSATDIAVDGLVLLILFGAVAFALLIWLLRRRSPAGLPERRFAREGVQPTEARAYGGRLASQVHPGRPFVIVSQTRQRARGAVTSEYLNPPRVETVVLDGGPTSYVYRTQLRFTDVTPNEEAEMPFLAPCGNPIRYGWIGRYFPGLNFEYLGEPEVIAEPAVLPPPVAEPEPVPVAMPPVPALMVGNTLALREGDTGFGMRRVGECVVIELIGAGAAQFMISAPASTVRYENGQFSFEGAGLPAGIAVPVPADLIAGAVVRQLTAPAEDQAAFDQLLIAQQTNPTA